MVTGDRGSLGGSSCQAGDDLAECEQRLVDGHAFITKLACAEAAVMSKRWIQDQDSNLQLHDSAVTVEV
jgi:hypothetical protein